jgi:shikimate dehydrogenase
VTSRRAGTTASTSLARLRDLVVNPLPDRVAGAVIGLIGDRPSSYSRSPTIWAAALRHLGLAATYLPLDVPPGRLEAVLGELRQMDGCWGANVTVPYKEAVIPLLDDVDPLAAAAGAVNTIVRRRGGRLVGTNTDGVGVVAALLHDDGAGPLLETLHGQTMLLIGAGGAARAAAVALAPLLGTGELLVTSRRHERALDLARRAAATGGRVRAIGDEALDRLLPEVDLVINASLRGQTGIRQGDEGWTTLEPYSALAPASPAVLPPMPESEFLQAWAAASAEDVAANHERSGARMRRLRPRAVVFDMVYAPPVTVTMHHAREAGLRAVGGRWMMIVQAAEACVAHICAPALAREGVDREAARSAVIQAMAGAWPDAARPPQPR